MHLLIVAVGQRLPAWAQAACDDYVRRFPPDWPLQVKAVKAEPRTDGRSAPQWMAAERARIDAAVPRGWRRVALDERGERVTTAQLAQRLVAWQHDGRDVALLMGGPDGLDAELRSGADERLRLSDLTLPHALARVVLVEALYRAWSVNAGHPYHRE
jgi:23S rRNA (pseudouridine1915-N3)-methyltransferase